MDYTPIQKTFGGMEFEPMLTPRKKNPPPEKFSPEEDQTHDAASNRTVSPTQYQQAILAPFLITWIHMLLILIKNQKVFSKGQTSSFSLLRTSSFSDDCSNSFSRSCTFTCTCQRWELKCLQSSITQVEKKKKHRHKAWYTLFTFKATMNIHSHDIYLLKWKLNFSLYSMHTSTHPYKQGN